MVKKRKTPQICVQIRQHQKELMDKEIREQREDSLSSIVRDALELWVQYKTNTSMK